MRAMMDEYSRIPGQASKVVAVIEARMNSSRLPGKVLLESIGAPMLAHMLNRVFEVPLIDEVVVATTTNSSDDPIVDLSEELGAFCFRGSEEDVLQRVVEAAHSRMADTVISLTADCPLIDPEIIDLVVCTHLLNGAAYTSNCHIRSFPDGMDVQAIELKALTDATARAVDPLAREHTTLFVRRNPERYSQIHVIAPVSLRRPEVALTLDTQEDFQLIDQILQDAHFIDRVPSCSELLAWVDANPGVASASQQVTRKGDA